MRFFLFPLLASIAVLSSGCSLNRMAARATAGVIEKGMPVYMEEEDVEFAGQSMASNLKLLEALIRSDPGNVKLLEMTAQGYCGYALMFAEEQFPERASLFYRRGAEYGQRALAESGLLNGGKIELEKVNRKTVPAVFWTYFCNAGYIQLHMDEPDALAGLSRVVPAM
ncbi:MAG TPA: TRAP transporter TatT component family protein, partial [bacterium]|nr:TRAP transporter TatT component family protein [bacterium]